MLSSFEMLVWWGEEGVRGRYEPPHPQGFCSQINWIQFYYLYNCAQRCWYYSRLFWLPSRGQWCGLLLPPAFIANSTSNIVSRNCFNRVWLCYNNFRPYSLPPSDWASFSDINSQGQLWSLSTLSSCANSGFETIWIIHASVVLDCAAFTYGCTHILFKI